MTTQRKPHVLIILDGFGHRDDAPDNAISNAKTPVWDKLWQEQPRTLISGSGMDVGLPHGQMGNSEVGHMNLGAGRVVYQDFTRITKAIDDGDFYTNATITTAVDNAIAANGAVHIMGLLSPGGVHSHQDHIAAMVKLADERGASAIYLHAFLDGRDTPPRSAAASIALLDDQLRATGKGRIASLCGRYFAMDRDNRWERIEEAYALMTEGQATHRFATAQAGLKAAYTRDESDEFVAATVVAGDNESAATVNDGDALIFMNFRADRARQISRAFTEADFSGFTRRKTPQLSGFVMLTQYAADINAPSAFPPESLSNVLGEYLSNLGKTQLRLAETEKYAHVTFFFSGGREDEFPGEERSLVPSPDVATYDLQPEMSAPEVTEKLVAAIKSGDYDFIVCNYANGDMVGHTGVYDAAVKAVETLDASLGAVTAAINDVGGDLLITADHGNCEQMSDHESGQPHTAHTTELVPLVYVGANTLSLRPEGGVLSDIAPTVLKLMDIPQPKEMTGTALF